MKFIIDEIRLFTSILLFFFVVSCSVNSSSIDFSSIKVLQENYQRNDLLDIAALGSENKISCSWKVSKESLNKQKMYNLSSLLEQVMKNRLISIANQFVDNAYSGKYKNEYVFKSFLILNFKREKKSI
jgi:hypothetical protein